MEDLQKAFKEEEQDDDTTEVAQTDKERKLAAWNEAGPGVIAEFLKDYRGHPYRVREGFPPRNRNLPTDNEERPSTRGSSTAKRPGSHKPTPLSKTSKEEGKVKSKLENEIFLAGPLSPINSQAAIAINQAFPQGRHASEHKQLYSLLHAMRGKTGGDEEEDDKTTVALCIKVTALVDAEGSERKLLRPTVAVGGMEESLSFLVVLMAAIGWSSAVLACCLLASLASPV